MENSPWVQLIVVLTNIAIVILAIWGPSIRRRIAQPRLRVALRVGCGDMSKRSGTLTHHLVVENRRKLTPAQRVRVLVVGLEKKKQAGDFYMVPVFVPLQLEWAHSKFFETFPTVGASSATCDLGHLSKDDSRFVLSTYARPESFRGSIGPNQTLRVRVKPEAENFEANETFVFEISWDGVWIENAEEMKNHLQVKQISLAD